MKKYLTIMLLFGFLSSHSIYFGHLGTSDGLSQISVMSIYQDNLGRMWFGTMGGLNIYDGEKTVSLRASDWSEKDELAMIGNANHSITGDSAGNVFFISDFAMIKYDLRQQKFTRIKDNSVTAVISHNGLIYAAIADSIFVYDDRNRELVYYGSLDDSDLRINKIFFDSEDNLWIGTKKGLYLKSGNRKQELKHFLDQENIYEIFEDSKKNIWISTRYKGYYCKKKGDAPNDLKLVIPESEAFDGQQIRCFVEDETGNIWMGAFQGLVKYNPYNQEYTVYQKDILPGSLHHSSIFSLCMDKQGSLWVGTYYGGVHHFNSGKDIFTLYAANAEREDCLSFPFVGHLVEDKDGHIWICTEGGGLNFLDRKTRRFKHYRTGGKKSIAHNNLKSICYSEKYNKLYIGTHIGGLSIFDIGRREFKNADSDASWKMLGNVVNQVAFYKDKYLVLLTQQGLFKLDLQTEHVSPLFDTILNLKAANFAIDSENYIWLSAGNSIKKIDLENNSDVINYESGKNGLGRFDVTKIFQDSKGRIFLGTEGSGIYLYNREKELFNKIKSVNNQLDNIYCFDMAESSVGYLIILSDRSLIFYNHDSNDVKNITVNTALPISGINLGCGLLVCRDGEIFVGGIDGMTSFNKRDLFSYTPAKYELYFSNLLINNKHVIPNDLTGVLKEALQFTKTIKLKHNQNNLIFKYTSNNYTSLMNQKTFEYRLEGFDSHWIVNRDGSISYTNLSPGRYTLFVREQQPDTASEAKTIKMDIVIRPPIYASALFYFIYIIVLVSIIYWFYRFKKSQILLRVSLDRERHEKEKNEALNQEKLQFFSNISHEFRTPLTLIISQIEILLQSNSLSPFVYNKLLKAYKNTHQIRNLINELLDFRKLEQGYMKLKISEKDIVSFLREIYLSFYEYAANHNITYNFKSSDETVLCWFDPKQMQKVFYNLISNAFKYSKPNGTIEVLIENEDKFLIFKIIDTGTGIEEGELEKIFDRFYQAANNSARTMKQAGSGIGLSLAKGIVELHRGTINVESSLDYGSIFIVRLLKGNSHFNSNEMSVEDAENYVDVNERILTVSPFDNSIESEEENMISEKPKILIVEDNKELLQLLENIFSNTYYVILAENGKEGLKKVRIHLPDIILSDVMMPEMSGTEMCLKIKTDFELCHIPVVLLTALSSTEHNIESLTFGADDYITKPFNVKVLLARCNNLVRNRIRLQKKFSADKTLNIKNIIINPLDGKFIEDVNRIIDENIDNQEFDMTELASRLALSRSSFYLKFKALTEMTPNEYALDRRLNFAASLLIDKPNLQITEISDLSGFSSSRYFTRIFKTKFGMTPMEWRKK